MSYVLGDVAGNEKTSVETLIRLSKGRTISSTGGWREIRQTPPGILSDLSRNDNEYTRDPRPYNPGDSA